MAHLVLGYAVLLTIALLCGMTALAVGERKRKQKDQISLKNPLLVNGGGFFVFFGNQAHDNKNNQNTEQI